MEVVGESNRPTTLDELSFVERNYSKAKCWLRYRWNGFLNLIRIPGFVREVEFEDLVTKQRFKVSISRYFTKISLGPRDYFFYRESGKFDGTGYSMCEPKAKGG